MQEVNFDGLVSPTHNYAGLAVGNLASTHSEGIPSRPREAALQGLAKMRTLARRGVPQAFLPPQLRPALPTLRHLGFAGSDAEVLEAAFRDDPWLFAAASSSSSMWTANAATVSPSCDSADGRVHFTPANLVTHFHRSIETAGTAETLRAVFRPDAIFAHHPPLPATPAFADEGAANHTRLHAGGETGTSLHLFVHGDAGGGRTSTRFPARQSREAGEAIARLHQLPDDRVLFLRQNPEAIDAGVFHNDVIATGHENVLLYHECAFTGQEGAIDAIRSRFAGHDLHLIEIRNEAVTLQQAVASYLFNSQIVTPADGDGGMLLLCPRECEEDAAVRRCIEGQILGGGNPIREVLYQDLRQSMRNGGGPACLRLRVVLTEAERAAIPPRLFFTAETDAFLRGWIERHHPETLILSDLADAERHAANAAALKELQSWAGLV